MSLEQQVDEETKTITFLLSWWDKPLSFIQDEFIYAIGLPIFKDAIPLRPKETSKAPTDLKTKKKRILFSFKPKSPYKVRVIPSKKQVTKTHHVDVTVATANATKNLVAFELAEEQGNQPSAAKAEKVLDQNVEDEVKDTGFVVMKEVTFKQIMDEVDSKTQCAQENVESPFDIELEIKIIKSYQATTISSSLFIHQSSLYDHDQNVINISPKDTKDGEAYESLSGLRSMHDDDLASLFGFKIQDYIDHDSYEGTAKTFHAFADKPAQSDPFGHLQEELNFLNNKVDQLESSISKKVVEDIQTSIPTIFADTLKSKLYGLLLKALNNILPKLLLDSIKTSVSESIAEKLP
nr:hypothetical protein [Tanacetum cinerariifolium]